LFASLIIDAHKGRAVQTFFVSGSYLHSSLLDGNVMNPALSKLFAITAAAAELGEEKKNKYHSISSKLLWVMNRSFSDFETAVSFLCTRVQAPTDEDGGKLRTRVLNFVKATKGNKRIMGTCDFLKLETWVDAYYTVHDNTRGHTGGCMSFG